MEYKFTRFTMRRALKPSTSLSQHSWWENKLGILFDIDGPHMENYFTLLRRARRTRDFIKTHHIYTDNYDDLGTYEKGNIIKYRGSYIEIEMFIVTGRGFFLLGKDLNSNLPRRLPLVMRQMKVYTLSERMDKKLQQSRLDYAEKQKTFKADLQRMLSEKNKMSDKLRTITPFGRYKVQR